ncbi:MAG: GxxExxY protein [Rhodopila sp.]|jgi:hypothetical protein
MHADEIRLNELSGRVIGCAFAVLNTLGAGFLEKVYENALAHELRKTGLDVVQQRGLTVTYYPGSLILRGFGSTKRPGQSRKPAAVSPQNR